MCPGQNGLENGLCVTFLYSEAVSQGLGFSLSKAIEVNGGADIEGPADLIRDRARTPFNIGTPIYLNGFTQSEAQPLAQGLTVQEGDAGAVLKAILTWTEGQPFLTQKL
ncbi:MAG: hypothetical protein AAGL17_03890, partial [Cyanobacteria bacterium J06576_12]